MAAVHLTPSHSSSSASGSRLTWHTQASLPLSSPGHVGNAPSPSLSSAKAALRLRRKELTAHANPREDVRKKQAVGGQPRNN